MENKNNVLVILLVAIVILLSWGLTKGFNERTITTPPIVCKEDSLREVVYDLKSELEMEEDGWDKREQRYEEALFEYEYGINQLKENRPEAYRYFHRIIGYRERYSKEVEHENKKRLNINKW